MAKDVGIKTEKKPAKYLKKGGPVKVKVGNKPKKFM